MFGLFASIGKLGIRIAEKKPGPGKCGNDPSPGDIRILF